MDIPLAGTPSVRLDTHTTAAEEALVHTFAVSSHLEHDLIPDVEPDQPDVELGQPDLGPPDYVSASP